MLTRGTHPTLLTALLNLAILAVILFAIWHTGNPLALLGLGLLHQLPCFPEELQLKAAQLGLLGKSPEIEDDDGYSDSKIGFFTPTK